MINYDLPIIDSTENLMGIRRGDGEEEDTRVWEGGEWAAGGLLWRSGVCRGLLEGDDDEAADDDDGEDAPPPPLGGAS